MLLKSTDLSPRSFGAKLSLTFDARFPCFLLLVAVFAMDVATPGGSFSPRPVQTAAAQLDLQVRDETGQPVFARVRLWSASGEAPVIDAIEPAEPVAIHPRQLDLGIVLPERGRIQLSPGLHTLRVDRGYRISDGRAAIPGQGGRPAAGNGPVEPLGSHEPPRMVVR